MSLELQREQEIVEAYHFDKRLPQEETTPETALNVEISPLSDYPNSPEGATTLGARLTFMLVFEDYVISGGISQINHLLNRTVEKEGDLDPSEVQELVNPLFDIVKRMTYEVTEIATDQPGLTLNFEPQA
jgi:hypothetical protein